MINRPAWRSMALKIRTSGMEAQAMRELRGFDSRRRCNVNNNLINKIR
jgi:hypothetical protein